MCRSLGPRAWAPDPPPPPNPPSLLITVRLNVFVYLLHSRPFLIPAIPTPLLTHLPQSVLLSLWSTVPSLESFRQLHMWLRMLQVPTSLPLPTSLSLHTYVIPPLTSALHDSLYFMLHAQPVPAMIFRFSMHPVLSIDAPEGSGRRIRLYLDQLRVCSCDLSSCCVLPSARLYGVPHPTDSPSHRPLMQLGLPQSCCGACRHVCVHPIAHIVILTQIFFILSTV